MKKRELLISILIILICLAAVMCLWFDVDLPNLVGSAFCHQISSRSPSCGDDVFPFCYRCAGMFLGIFFSISYILISKKKIALFSSYAITFWIVAVLFFAVDVVNSTTLLSVNLYEESPYIRLLSGFVMGSAIPLVLIPILSFVKTGKKDGDAEPGYFFVFMCVDFAVCLICIFLLMAQNKIAFEMLSLISTYAAILICFILFLILCYAMNNEKSAFVYETDMYLLALILSLLFILSIGFYHLEFLGSVLPK